MPEYLCGHGHLAAMFQYGAPVAALCSDGGVGWESYRPGLEGLISERIRALIYYVGLSLGAGQVLDIFGAVGNSVVPGVMHNLELSKTVLKFLE